VLPTEKAILAVEASMIQVLELPYYVYHAVENWPLVEGLQIRIQESQPEAGEIQQMKT
jgi:hypothetical protein